MILSPGVLIVKLPKIGLKICILLAAATTFLAPPARAADEGSNIPYRLIVGFPPGGALDTLARILAEQLHSSLKEPVLVENRPGASSRISIDYVKMAKADGRTILLAGTPAFVLFPLTYSNLDYDVNRDFVPLAHLTDVPNAVFAGASQPYKTIPDYVAWVKKNPTQSAVGMTNLGGVLHFSVLQMSQQIGVPLEPVTYKGGAPLATDVIGGHIPLGTDALASLLELHRAGKLRILGIGGTKRISWLPDIPTISEMGVSGFNNASPAYGAFVPAGTPPDAVKKLEAAMLSALQNGSVRERLEQIGLSPTGLPGAALKKSMDDERAYWVPIVKQSGFRALD